MPWKESSVMDERLRFVEDVYRGVASMSELCARYGISRTAGYDTLARFAAQGVAGLVDRSHRPGRCPHAIAPEVVAEILELQQRYTWGARKVRRLLLRRDPTREVPSIATVHRTLARHGRVRPRGRSRRRAHPGRPLAPMTEPNAVWSADFKGHFRMGSGLYCYPLTVQDGASRFLLGCVGMLAPTIEGSWPVFERLFRRYGLPERLRTDNGTPFASGALGRLSTLSVWWIRLGILPDLIEPAHPEQNGRHERMHKTLKAATARPPGADLPAQQQRFDRFRREYNEVRPHEALDDETPTSCYVPSMRPYPRRLPPLEYPGHFEVRRVSRNGGIRWHHVWVNVSHLLAEEYVGLEAVDEGLWDVYFGPVWLGRMHETTHRIVDQFGHPARREGGNHKGKGGVSTIN
jgi:putative transposase